MFNFFRMRIINRLNKFNIRLMTVNKLPRQIIFLNKQLGNSLLFISYSIQLYQFLITGPNRIAIYRFSTSEK